MESPGNEQFIRFKLHAVLGSVMKSRAVLPCPAWKGIIPWSIISVLCKLPAHQSLRSHLRYQINCQSIPDMCSSHPYFM